MMDDLERALGAVPASRRRRLARAMTDVRDDCSGEDPVFADILNGLAIALVDLEADERRAWRGLEEQLLADHVRVMDEPAEMDDDDTSGP